MSEERKAPVWLWTAALLIGLPLLYLASFGPVCWLANRTDIFENGAIPRMYLPIGWLCEQLPPVRSAMWQYGRLGMTGTRAAMVPIGSDSWDLINLQ